MDTKRVDGGAPWLLRGYSAMDTQRVAGRAPSYTKWVEGRAPWILKG